MQYKAHGGDGSASVRPYFSQAANAAMGALAAQALTLFSAERSQSTQYRTEDFSEGDPGGLLELWLSLINFASRTFTRFMSALILVTNSTMRVSFCSRLSLRKLGIFIIPRTMP